MNVLLIYKKLTKMCFWAKEMQIASAVPKLMMDMKPFRMLEAKMVDCIWLLERQALEKDYKWLILVLNNQEAEVHLLRLVRLIGPIGKLMILLRTLTINMAMLELIKSCKQEIQVLWTFLIIWNWKQTSEISAIFETTAFWATWLNKKKIKTQIITWMRDHLLQWREQMERKALW